MNIINFLLALFFFSFTSSLLASSFGIIQGEKSRFLHNQAPQEYQEYGKSVGALFYYFDEVAPEAKSLSNLTKDQDGNFSMKIESFAKSIENSYLPKGGKLCKDHEFYNLKTSPSCSVFLIGKNKIATAGHCLTAGAKRFSLVKDHTPTSNKISSLKVIFNEFLENKQDKKIHQENIYTIKKILAARDNRLWGDFAILELDRDVKGASPLKVNLESYYKQSQTKFLAIGHAFGLPLVYSETTGNEFKNQHIQQDYFSKGWKTSLDIAEGMSGGPLIDLSTGEVVAINVNYDPNGLNIKNDGFVLNEEKQCYEEFTTDNLEPRSYSTLLSYALENHEYSFEEVIFTGSFERSSGLPTVHSLKDLYGNLNKNIISETKKTPLYYATYRYVLEKESDSFEYLVNLGAELDIKAMMLMKSIQADDSTLFDIYKKKE